MASVLAVRKKGCCYRIIARDIWGELMGPGSLCRRRSIKDGRVYY